MLNCLFVGLGGFVGTVCRYLMSRLPFRAESGFPMITLFINVLGAFCIGIIAGLASKNAGLSPNAVLFLKVGVCGGFTTFSAFSLETFALIQNGAHGTAILYALLSVILCVAAVFGAQLLIR